MTYEEYNPWLNGDASWLNGIHDNGHVRVEIDTLYSTVSIDYPDGMGYFLQGDEADEFVKQVAWNATMVNTHLSFSANVLDYVENYYI